ncbi:MAG: ROK family protein [Proteobacteria bacterium]|nr:ROK family protein [Pseudomonadota bacterium]
MVKEKEAEPKLALPAHGSATLPSVIIDAYNAEIQDDEGFIGDKVCKSVFWELVEKWRRPLREEGEDPFGKTPTEDLNKKQLAEELEKGDAEAAALVQSAIEDYSQEFARVIQRFLKLKSWRDTETIVIGGGFRGSRIGELAINRTALLLKSEKIDVALELIHNKPDDAGLIGAAHLLPPWMLKGHDAMLAVDIGGTNIRVGTVTLNLHKSPDLTKAKVAKSKIWCHAEKAVDRDRAVRKLAEMLEEQISWCEEEKLMLAPVVGIACPGIIKEDGSIDRGGQNLPGNWSAKGFHLPSSIQSAIPEIQGSETLIVLHNDAVVQGLSELPHMQKLERWGVLTIGTGLGNARFTNRGRNK